MKLLPHVSHPHHLAPAAHKKPTRSRGYEHRFARVARLKRDLQVDWAITSGQLQRHYGLEELEPLAKPFIPMVRTLYPSADVDTYAHMTVYTLEKKVLRYQHGPLLHLIGTAEMRHTLGVPTELWRSSSQRMNATLIPDAIWSTPDGDIAIEYDTGTYRYKLIKQKVEAFSECYAGIIWGTPSPERCTRIKGKYPWVRTLCVADLDSLAGTKDSRI